MGETREGERETREGKRQERHTHTHTHTLTFTSTHSHSHPHTSTHIHTHSHTHTHPHTVLRAPDLCFWSGCASSALRPCCDCWLNGVWERSKATAGRVFEIGLLSRKRTNPNEEIALPPPTKTHFPPQPTQQTKEQKRCTHN